MNTAVIYEVGTKDTRVDAVDEGLILIKWTFNQFIAELKNRHPEYKDLVPSIFYRWRNGESTGRNKPWAADGYALIFDLVAKFSPPHEKLATSRHFSGITVDQDSAGAADTFDLSKLIETINVSCSVIRVGSPWSAKGMQHVNIKLSALLGAAVEHIVITGDLDNVKSGMVMSFLATDFPSDGIYTLFKSKAEPGSPEADQCILGWVPTQHPTSIQTTPGANPELRPLSEWQAIGYAVCISWGPGDRKPRMSIDINGIGPSTQIYR